MLERDWQELTQRAVRGDSSAIGALLDRHRSRLLRMVQLRMDQRLQGRIDPGDVVQEACAEAARRLDEYLQRPDVPFYIWLRFLSAQKLAELHRHHVRVQARSVDREVALFQGWLPEASSALLAAQLLGRATTPSQAAIRAERQRRLQDALDELDSADREILVLRHFEQLSNIETAGVLGLNESTASRRHLRALKRLKRILSAMPEFHDAGRGLA